MKKTVFAILAVIAVSGCTRQKHVSSLLIGGEPGRYTTKTTKDELPRFADKTTLADCLAYAALNNAGLEAAFNRWKAAADGGRTAAYTIERRNRPAGAWQTVATANTSIIMKACAISKRNSSPYGCPNI